MTGTPTHSMSPDTTPIDVDAFTYGIEEIARHALNKRSFRPAGLLEHSRLQRMWEVSGPDMMQRANWSEDAMQRWQLERLRFLVDLAYSYVPFYRKLYHSVGYRTGDIVSWSDYHKLPEISKADIAGNEAELLNPLLGDRRGFHQNRTSGSSGKSLTIYRDDAAVDVHTLQWIRQYGLMMGRPLASDEWRYETYLAPPRFSSVGSLFPMFTVSQDCPPGEIASHISRLRPTVLASFPSFLSRLASECGDLHRYGVRLVVTNSEASSREERRALSKIFKVPVQDEYSSEEMQIIASECRCGTYAINEDNVRVDVDGQEGSVGEMIATNLWNIQMPLIRYRHGDLVRISEAEAGPCRCGIRWRRITELHGRIDDALTAPRGKISTDQVLGLYDRTLIPMKSGIAEFQIVQTAPRKIVLHMVLQQGVVKPEPSAIADFRSGLENLFGVEIEFCTNVCTAIDYEGRTKRRLVLNKLLSSKK